jgi:hypothetical protein
MEMSLLAIRQHESSNFDRLEMVLGTLWSEESFRPPTEEEKKAQLKAAKVVNGPSSTHKEPPRKIRINLATLIKPEIQKIIEEQFKNKSRPYSHVPEGSVNLFDLPKAEFQKIMSGVAKSYKAHAPIKEKPVKKEPGPKPKKK